MFYLFWKVGDTLKGFLLCLISNYRLILLWKAQMASIIALPPYFNTVNHFSNLKKYCFSQVKHWNFTQRVLKQQHYTKLTVIRLIFFSGYYNSAMFDFTVTWSFFFFSGYEDPWPKDPGPATDNNGTTPPGSLLRRLHPLHQHISQSGPSLMSGHLPDRIYVSPECTSHHKAVLL